MNRRVRTIQIYRTTNGTHELHLGERWIGGEDRRTVERFETFHEAYGRVEGAYGGAYASALIDSLLSLKTPVLEGATV